MSRRTLGLLALAAVAAACQRAETPEQRAARLAAHSDSAKTAIEAQLARFERWAPAGQFDSIARLYTEDAIAMPPGAPAVRGRDSIVAMMTAGGPFTIDFTVVSVWSDGETALEHGTYAFSMTPPGAQAVNMTGKYMARWVRTPNTWMMTHDIWNDDAPMAPPAPEPARRRQ